MICEAQIMDKRDLDVFFGFQGVLAACRKAMLNRAHNITCNANTISVPP